MKWNGPIIILLAALLAAAPASGKDPVDHGSEIFYGTSLSTNGKSCSTCHPNGRTLEGSSNFKVTQLPMIINECIRNGLGGFPLLLDSKEMEDLIAFMQNLSVR
ncbi:MAG TPA: cytochrome C [Geobacter sp.]|nr:cytochrome C [Geobacter sp.]